MKSNPALRITPAPTGTEVILLTEDIDQVRDLMRQILEVLGYVVYEACNGREGLAFCKTHEGRVDLLVSDVVMPGLSARELADKALKLRPGMRVLFVSGHTEDVALTQGNGMNAAFLQKPFTAGELAQKVRETLDSLNVQKDPANRNCP